MGARSHINISNMHSNHSSATKPHNYKTTPSLHKAQVSEQPAEVHYPYKPQHKLPAINIKVSERLYRTNH
jgi:hypothetical protein